MDEEMVTSPDWCSLEHPLHTLDNHTHKGFQLALLANTWMAPLLPVFFPQRRLSSHVARIDRASTAHMGQHGRPKDRSSRVGQWSRRVQTLLDRRVLEFSLATSWAG